MDDPIDDLTGFDPDLFDSEDGDDAGLAAPDLRQVELAAGEAGGRLDKTLADRLPLLSRGRVQALLAAGQITLDGRPVSDASSKAAPGLYEVRVPAPTSATPLAEDIPLDVLFEDQHLIVVNKPAGMAAHPAPGTPGGTLVNALLHHCGDSLSGIGGVLRPGIVHRLDKETTGVMVAAKSDAAHNGLSALFSRHDIDRAYIAFVRGGPRPLKGTIEGRIGRSHHDRKKMAILRTGGREAITHYEVQDVYGPDDRPMAAKVLCRLETGRTHQIRVHLSSKGHACLGDPVYGSSAPATAVRQAIAEAGLRRQALHAAVLGFVHPVTGEALRFKTPLPDDLLALEAALAGL
ncbi:MAG: RluA family pseudouridine synthase [Caulobacter sp.]|nr:RluA family pseudouridine synthase [Caulobacter sp.]